MDFFQVVAPLLGVLLGSLLSGIGIYFKARQERARVIALALSDLLEVRHRMVGIELILNRVLALGLLQMEHMSTFRNMIESIIPDDPELNERYDTAVSLLAGIEPVLAFRLRSRNGLPKALASLRKLATEHQSNLGDFEKLERSLKAAATPNIDRALQQLARSHSFVTWYKVRKHIKLTVELPIEIESLITELSGQALTNGASSLRRSNRSAQ